MNPATSNALQWSAVNRADEIESRWAVLRQPPAAAHENAAENVHQCRALTLNLVVRVADAADAARMAGYLWRLGPRHPARVFLVSPHADGLHLQVAAQEQGSEMLHVALPPERAAAFLTPLLQSDLPALLLWRGGRPQVHAEFEPLAALADRVLVDAQFLGLGAADVAALAQRLRGWTHLADLSWTRLTPWRQLLYQGLETTPGAAQRVTAVTIAAPAGPANMAALLLAGWLARQLQWTPAQRLSAASLQLLRPAASPPAAPAVTLAFQTTPPGRSAALLGVQVEGEGFRVAICHHGPHLEMSVHHGEQEIGHWAGAALTDQRREADCLAVELSISGGDPLYRAALASACAIARQLEGQP
ncbi:MAG TPA: glucose-6-phosphate dehydrogenase assembly protein OpcA [Terriglobales bacterium]|nr:glucose-6-phosphate dehydrogenase assembly protein OpcA [Terriglobales bacterium]